MENPGGCRRRSFLGKRDGKNEHGARRQMQDIRIGSTEGEKNEFAAYDLEDHRSNDQKKGRGVNLLMQELLPNRRVGERRNFCKKVTDAFGTGQTASNLG